MKILKYIACSFLPLAIMSNNDTMALRSKVAINNQISNNNIDGVMKLYNGGAMCSLASLNQCISALNPGNNEILKQFIEQYNNIANNKNINKNSFQPNYILNNVLDYAPRDEYKKILLEKGGVDIAERYQSLIDISKQFGADITCTNPHFMLKKNGSNNLINEITKISSKKKDFLDNNTEINNNTANLVLHIENMDIFNQFSNDIHKGILTVNDNNFELSSIAFRSISQNDYKKIYNNRKAKAQCTHFISAKKLANGKWALVDSLPVSIKVYDSFKSLMNSLGNRYLPRMVFFPKHKTIM